MSEEESVRPVVVDLPLERSARFKKTIRASGNVPVDVADDHDVDMELLFTVKRCQ